MKPILHTIKFLCLLGVALMGESVFGQVPPYQLSTTEMLREAEEPSYYLSYSKGWIKYYLRESIPFYTMFNYNSIEDYTLETNFQRFYFRKFSSFTAPKGVNKITYYLGNNLVDSIKATTHIFYFNKNTNLLEREIQSEKDSLGLKHTKEYNYKYEETELAVIVQKLVMQNDTMTLINQYTYSKDKTKLLKNEYASVDYQFEFVMRDGYQFNDIKKFGRVPTSKKVEFIYDDKNNIIETVQFGAVTPEYNFIYDAEILDYSKEEPYTHGWSEKNNWLIFLNKNEEEGRSVSFPKEIDLRFPNHYSFSYSDKGNSKLYDTPNQKFRIKAMNSENVYISDYYELDNSYIITSSARSFYNSHFYSNYKILLFNNRNKINNVYIAQNFHISLYKARNWGLTDNTPLDYIFLTRKKNKYVIDHLQKKVTFIENSIYRMYWNDENLDDFKIEEDNLKKEQFLLELKPKKGLNEIYLIRGNKTYPLVTIN